MAGAQVAYYGIRHHGPGSARRLLEALGAEPPDLLLVELPAEAEAVLPYLGREELKPPVALLLFEEARREAAAYLPFAVFSPEWQALRFAAEKGIPARAIDLPQAAVFCRENERRASSGRRGCREGLVAEVLHDAWWDRHVETTGDGAVWGELAALIAALREQVAEDDPLTLRREAWMRRCIRGATAEGHKRIAVVVGAWHVPAIMGCEKDAAEDFHEEKIGPGDADILASWIPWSYARLSRGAGYGAGVESPLWYELLWRGEAEAVSRWMIHAARFFREKGLPTSTAEVIEARRLAYALAQLQQREAPGAGQLFDAVVSVMLGGNAEAVAGCREALMVGEVYGSVPADLPLNPVRREVEEELRACRLFTLWQQGRAAEKNLDLRKPQHARISRLLHRLLILDIPWGREIEPEREALGSFAERWALRREGEYEGRLVAAGMYGGSLAEACANYLLERAAGGLGPEALAAVLLRSVRAGLPAVPERLLHSFEGAMVAEDRVGALLRAYVILAGAERYGSVLEALPAVPELLDACFPRIMALLPRGLGRVTDEEAPALWLSLREFVARARLRGEERLGELLASLLHTPPLCPFLSGAVTALLRAEGLLDGEALLRRSSLWLTDRSQPEAAAAFVEGLLAGIGAALLQDAEWLALLERFVEGLDDGEFVAVLPVLRRGFSTLAEAERRALFTRVAGSGGGGAGIGGGRRDSERQGAYFDVAMAVALWERFFKQEILK